MAPKMTISVFLDVTYFEVFFGQVWKNADKIPSHPQKFACFYTYVCHL